MRYVHAAAYATLIYTILKLLKLTARMSEYIKEADDTIDDYRQAYGMDRWRIINFDEGNWT